jgi:hypothetical protein
MKRLKQGPMKQLRRRKCKLRNHMTSKEGQFKRKCILRNHKTLKEGATRRKNHRKLKNNNRWRLF